MSEDEISKHTKAAVKVFRDPEKNWRHKVKDIVTEILIIIFAVTVSIWLHNRSDEMHEQKEAKVFLTGLREDLRGDIGNMKNSLQFYTNVLNGLTYFSKVGSGTDLEKDSLQKYAGIFFGSTELQPHISRYEGLKGSGKFKIIENNELLNHIINLHEESLVRITNLNAIYDNFNVTRVVPFLSQHLQLDAPGRITNAADILRITEMRFYLSFEKGLIANNIIKAYGDGITECEGIIKQIDEELK